MWPFGNKTVRAKDRKAYLIGGGIASLAAAVYLIKDGKLNPENITIYEQGSDVGGGLDAHELSKRHFFARGERMFTREVYNCTLDLMSHVPVEPGSHKTLLDDFNEYNTDPRHNWDAKARLVENGQILDAKNLGLSARDELDIIKLFVVPESSLDGLRLDEIFTPAFFKTNHWYMFRTTFAFQPWHSAIEARRYAWRFIQEFPHMTSMSRVLSSRYNQYDSLSQPTATWLEEQGAVFCFDSRVDSLHFVATDDQEERVARIDYVKNHKRNRVDVEQDDLVFFTNGSMVTNTSLGNMKRAPGIITTKPNDAWALWAEIAKNRPHFGNPAAFAGPITRTKCGSFSISFTNTLFSDLLEIFTKSAPGTEGIITFKDSSWVISLVATTEPHFKNQPKDINFRWGYVLGMDKPGNFVKKKFSDCTGAEVLTEICMHLGFEKELKDILASADCIPCMMPYITSQFMPRKNADRPAVIPARTKNFAFIGQYCEIPDEIVFTVEQSVRSAIIAVYGILGVEKDVPPIYEGRHDPEVVKELLDLGYDIAITQRLLHREPGEKNYIEA